MLTRGLAALLLLGAATLPAAAHAAASQSAGPGAATSVVGIVAESGVDFLHPDFATVDGKDAYLPSAVRRQVQIVSVPQTGSRAERLTQLRRGPLGRPKPGRAYYVRGTRLVVVAAEPGADLTVSAFHGTAVASVAAGRRFGTAKTALMVVVIGRNDEAWAWAAKQSWIDVMSTSTFPIVGATDAPYLCSSAKSVSALRRRGHLLFAAAGNGPEDSYFLPPGGLPQLIRVGGVHPDGTTVNPYVDGTDHAPYMYSAREYDVAELFTVDIADTSASSGYSRATGTSGSSPRVAGRVAQLIADLRRAVHDEGVGVRGGALVVSSPAYRPARGPLADGMLTADELEAIVLHRARPALPEQPGRYVQEGYGFFDAAGAAQALSEALGKTSPSIRAQDDREHDAALQLRSAQAAARACASG